MNKYNFFTLAFIFFHTMHFANASSDHTNGTNKKYTTQLEFLNGIIASYKKNPPDNEAIKATKELITEGKKLALKGDYLKAIFHYYGTAYAWIPRPEYLFIMGDLELREKLSAYDGSHQKASKKIPCWDKYKFNLDMREILQKNFDRGFDFSTQLKLTGVLNSKIYEQARINAACIMRLADENSEGVGSTCVPHTELKKCLGEPLLLL
jgi:hypothetical protein